ncbi:UDP-glucose 6-dehydrogenase TuaD [Bacillus horti]|uniref:UDP-glucose 6-dehydrogenase n=1 Tax=Caldalkalibacillus horti TaxID=77523 RepID=A0ABT9VZR7_9BACI|nr:UDP-glucose/GDP-mannose dehydrogenase family protein [Bacillus horti]MDQ0166369.1 UDPglucose 6-dehydrogenase [Bacillus horti]
MKKIAVLGTGYVGLVSGTCFAEIGNQVICCDIDEGKILRLQQGEIPIYEPGLEDMVKKNQQEKRLSFTSDIPKAIQESEIIYLAVGTPMSESGEADLSYVKAAAKTIGQQLNSYKIIVNKSTVPVGTGKLVKSIIKEHVQDSCVDFDVVSNPEFLREGSALEDCMNMERAVIGADNDQAGQIIADLHEPFHTTIFRTDIESAEMIKYAANAFLATKISFINDIANICERVGADVTHVAEGMGMDSRIGSKFLQAGIGYGGSCFPKDTQALVHIAQEVGYDLKLVQSVIQTNEQQKYAVVHKAKEIMGDVNGKTIAVLGLAFKPNTDDIRYAPSLTVIPELIKAGANVKAFDPIAIPATQQEFSMKLSQEQQQNIAYSTDLYGVLEGSDACLILTEWQEVLQLDLEQAKSKLKVPLIIDGRNCFSLEMMLEKGFTYHSIGRPAVDRLRIPV